MPTLTPLSSSKTQAVTALPGGGTWLCASDKEGSVTVGALGGKARSATYGGRKSFEVSVIGLHGIDARTVALTDGLAVGRFEVGEAGPLKRLARWALPGEMGWRAHLASSPSGERVAVASDLRLGVFGAESKVIQEQGGSENHFWALGFLPDGETLAVGRGDGRVELRDARTLEVRKTFSVLKQALLALCVLDAQTLALADDNAITGLLHLETGAFEELDLQHMKTSGLHRLEDGRLLAVGLSRQLTVFEGTKRVRGLDLSAELGDRYIQASAVSGRTLLLACEQRGLLSLELDRLPVQAEAPTLDLPLPAAQLRAQTAAAVELALLQETLAAKRDASGLVAKLLELDDEGVHRQVFMLLMNAKVALPDAAKHLASANARVRYYAADLFGEQPEVYAGRSAELLPLLGDPDPQVIAAAAWSLGRLGDAAHGPALEALLRHPTAWVSNTAANALLALKTGFAALTLAMRGGASGLTVEAYVAIWKPKAGAALPIEAKMALAHPLPVAELLRHLGFAARPEFLAQHADARVQAQALAPQVSAVVVFIETARAQGWPLVVEHDLPVVAPLAEAADFWARALPERLAG
jgi:hypothetical protein